MNFTKQVATISDNLINGILTESEAKKLLYNMLTEEKLDLAKDSIDASYFIGCINVGGMDKALDEMSRLKEMGVKPHDIIRPI